MYLPIHISYIYKSISIYRYLYVHCIHPIFQPMEGWWLCCCCRFYNRCFPRLFSYASQDAPGKIRRFWHWKKVKSPDWLFFVGKIYRKPPCWCEKLEKPMGFPSIFPTKPNPLTDISEVAHQLRVEPQLVASRTLWQPWWVWSPSGSSKARVLAVHQFLIQIWTWRECGETNDEFNILGIVCSTHTTFDLGDGFLDGFTTL